MANEWNVLLKRIPSHEDKIVGEVLLRYTIDLAHGRPHMFEEDAVGLADVVLDSFADEIDAGTLGDLIGWSDGEGDEGPRPVPDMESPAWKVIEDHVQGLAVLAVKYVPDELGLKTERSRAFDRGNYAAAYEDPSDTATVPEGYATHQRFGYLLGFYSSRELSEIPNLEHRVLVGRLRRTKSDPGA